MARPKGYKLCRTTFEWLLVERVTSKTEVAAGAGLNLSTISDLCKGRNGASAATARALALALHCPAVTLFPDLDPDRAAAA